MRTIVIVVVTVAAVRSPAADRPDIVLILADDLGWSDLGCYGNTLHDTPHIDRLAAQGLRLTQAYAPAPICSASRAAILTGKTPARLGFEFVTKNKPGRQELDTPLQSPPFMLNLPLEEITLGDALRSAGYRTGFFGKWHVNRHHEHYLGWSPTHGPLQQGFDDGHATFGAHPYAYRKQPVLKSRSIANGEYPEDELTNRAIEFLSAAGNEPRFLYLSHYFVHDPIHTRCDWLLRKYRQRLPDDAPDVRAAYGAMVETLNHLVGRILAALDASGRADNTLVILTSDNGGHPNYMSNAPLRGSKWNLYEGGIRVPMIVRWPGRIPRGSVADQVVHGCDLFPTLCRIGAADIDETGLDGIDVGAVWRDPETPLSRETPLVWHFPYYHPENDFETAPSTVGLGDFATSQTRPHSAIRSGNWKLLTYYEDGRKELYRLSDDLSEGADLSQRHAGVADQLSKELKYYLKDVDARLPTPREAAHR